MSEMTLAERAAVLDAIYAELPTIECQGHCQESCGPFPPFPAEQDRLLYQYGRSPGIEHWTCPLLVAGRCRAYEIRPLLCRLWGGGGGDAVQLGMQAQPLPHGRGGARVPGARRGGEMNETKVCRGPLHPDGVALPLTREHWHFYASGRRKGRSLYPCRLCRATSRAKQPTTNVGLVPVAGRLREVVTELLGRVGVAEAVRLTGLSDTTVRALKIGRKTHVRRHTAAVILAVTRELRQGGVMYHRLDAKQGAGVRRRRSRPLLPVRKISDQIGAVYPDLEAVVRRQDADRARTYRERIKKEQAEREERLLDLQGY